MRRTLDEFKVLRESEDHVEFKKGEGGNISYNGGIKAVPKERRKCILGYVTALCNEKGGDLVIGMHDAYPHKVIGTQQSIDAIGDLEANIYKDSGIRTDIYELYEGEKRVLVINVPPRPLGRVFKFEDVALMRVGEELLPMSDEMYRSILQEQEPDFSQQFCDGVSFEDLDKNAIAVLKDKYAKKQKNPSFLSLSDEQALSDLSLIAGDRVTNAAVILLGKEDILKKHFPQARVSLEYRSSEANIHFDSRSYFCQPFFLMADILWARINDRNGSVPIRSGLYKDYDIPLFNEDVIREAVNNAIAHRDYHIQSETVIKQYPTKMVITNSGGLPYGVTIDNIIYVPSTPRNRLLADVLSKTGLVERSGQGVDQIFLNTLSEGKPIPDYSQTDDFCVTLILSAQIEDMAFSQFIKGIQDGLPNDQRLTVYDVTTLNAIRLGKPKKELDKKIVSRLLKDGYVEQRGKTSGTFYILGKEYYELSGQLAEYSKITDWNEQQVLSVMIPFLEKNEYAKMTDFVALFAGHLSKKQVRVFVEKLVSSGIINYIGETSARKYRIGDRYREQQAILNKALAIGLNEMKGGKG